MANRARPTAKTLMRVHSGLASQVCLWHGPIRRPRDSWRAPRACIQRSLRKVNRSLFAVMLAFWSLVVLPAAEAELSRYEFSQLQMGVSFRIVLYAEDERSAKTAADAAFQRIK